MISKQCLNGLENVFVKTKGVEMGNSEIDNNVMVEIPLSMLMDILAPAPSTPDDVPADSFPKSSKTDQRAKFLNLLDSSSNQHLRDVTSNLVTMLNDGRSSFEIVLFLNSLFENSLRNTIYFGFHRILFCDDLVLKNWLPHLRIDTDSFIKIVEKIFKDSNLMMTLSGNQVLIKKVANFQLRKLFPLKSEANEASDLAFNFLQARSVRHQIIHGSRIGRTQATDWGKLTGITEAQSFRACIALFSMLEAFDEVATELFFKPIESKFNPFQPDMRGKSEAGARANEHQTKLILESCGVSSPLVLTRKTTS